jgi:hypothetical protein
VPHNQRRLRKPEDTDTWEAAMPYAIELFLDEPADDRIRQIWAALDDHGIPSLGSIPGAGHPPHVSLSVFDHGDPAEITDALRPILVACAGLPLPLAPLGYFLTDESPVFLGVIPSARLLTLHRAVHRAIEPLVDNVWPYYRPDALLPHCTLAVGVADRAGALGVVARFPTPIPAVARGAYLVETPGGTPRTPLISA